MLTRLHCSDSSKSLNAWDAEGILDSHLVQLSQIYTETEFPIPFLTSMTAEAHRLEDSLMAPVSCISLRCVLT